MHSGAPIAVSLFGLLVIAPSFVSPQENIANGTNEAGASFELPRDVLIDEIKFVGLRHITAGAAASSLPFHCGEKLDAARIAAGVRALNRLGWFEDVSVRMQEPHRASERAFGPPPHLQLEFHVKEYPLLMAVVFSGSEVLSQQHIDKLLEDKKLSPQAGAPANPVKLHRVAIAIQSELTEMGHPKARVLIRQETLSRQRAKIEFHILDGPHLRVVGVNFSGHPEIPDKVLRKQMRQVSPDAWFSGLRNKNIYTQEKCEEDRASLLTYLQNHGFPQARVGVPQITVADSLSRAPLRWLHHETEAGLIVGLPVEAGTFYTFGPTVVSAPVEQKLNAAKRSAPVSPDISPGHPFSQQAVESQRRDWELRLRRTAQRQKRGGDYRLRASSALDGTTHLASVRFAFESTPPALVRRIEFRGNQRFPDRYLRRRIGLTEGEALDEYALEAGLARIARTGYFLPLKKEDVTITTDTERRTADVSIHVHEKGKQRVTFSGGREQFGSTVGIAYTVFNLLGLDEFLSTQIDGGPETLQLAMGLAKEGFLGSRGTLALSVFDTFVRPRFATGVQGPFERTQTEGANAGWTYAVSDVDAVGINFGLSRSLTEYSLNAPTSSAAPQITDAHSETSSHSLGIGWTHYSGVQKIQLTDALSGGWLGGSENLLKSKLDYGHIFPDEIFDHQNAFAFHTTVSAAGSYEGDMPVYARFFSGDDLVRGLRPGELGPYEILAATSPSAGTTYSAVPTGANLIAGSSLEYRFPLHRGVQGATFFDAGSGLLLPNWLGSTRPTLINSTNGLFHGSTGLELRWTLPVVKAPLRINYSFNIFRLNRTLSMPDGSVLHLHDHFAALGWGLGSLF